MASGFYPALPDARQVNPLVAAGAGVGLGQEIGGTALRQQSESLNLDQQRRQAEAQQERSEHPGA